MPIEFECPQCNNRLRTPDGTEGRTAQCPSCSAHVAIPNPESAGEMQADAPRPASDRHESADGPFNPYSAPAADTLVPDEGPIADLAPTRVTAGEIFSTCWRTFRDNLMHFFLLGLVLIALQIGGQVISLPLGVLAGVFAEAESILGIVLVQIVNIVWSQLLGTFCSAVAVRYCLNVINGSREPMKGAFDILPIFLRLFFAQIIVTLLVYAAGFAAFSPFFLLVWMSLDGPVLLIGGIGLGLITLAVIIAIWARLLLTFIFIIDRDQGIIESMSSSFAYTRGNAMAIFLGFYSILFLAVIFMIFTCLVGSVLAWPYLIMSMVVIYRMVTGQSVGGANPFASPK